MATIYLKFKSGETVMTLRGKNLKTVPQQLINDGWTQIKRSEFLRIRESIRTEHPLDLPEPSKSSNIG